MTIHVVSVLFFSNKKKVMQKWQFSSVLFSLFPRELQFQQKCGLSKSMNSLGGPIESEDPNRNDNDKNIPGCSHSESSSYSNVDHLVGVKDIRNCISLLVRYRNGDHYSIVFDLENRILKIKNEPSFLSELKSFSSYRNSSSLNNGSKSEDPFSDPSMDKNKDCSNSINRCIAGYLHFKTGIDTYNGSGNENYCGASFVDCFIKRDYLEHLRWLRGIRRGNFSHLWVQCDNEECSGLNYKKYFKQKMYICEHCSSHLKMTSSDRIELLLDLGTWDPMDEDIVCVDPIQWDFVEDDDEEEKEEEGNSNIECASEIECALESEEPLDSEEEEKPWEEPLDSEEEEKPWEESLDSKKLRLRFLMEKLRTYLSLQDKFFLVLKKFFLEQLKIKTPLLEQIYTDAKVFHKDLDYYFRKFLNLNKSESFYLENLSEELLVYIDRVVFHILSTWKERMKVYTDTRELSEQLFYLELEKKFSKESEEKEKLDKRIGDIKEVIKGRLKFLSLEEKYSKITFDLDSEEKLSIRDLNKNNANRIEEFCKEQNKLSKEIKRLVESFFTYFIALYLDVDRYVKLSKESEEKEKLSVDGYVKLSKESEEKEKLCVNGYVKLSKESEEKERLDKRIGDLNDLKNEILNQLPEILDCDVLETLSEERKWALEREGALERERTFEWAWAEFFSKLLQVNLEKMLLAFDSEEKPWEEPLDSEEKPWEEPLDSEEEEKPWEEPLDSEEEEKPSEEPLDSEEEEKPSEEPLDSEEEEKPSEEPLSSEEIKKNILEQILDVDEKLSKMLLDLDSEEEEKPSEEPLSSEEEEKPSEDKSLSSEEEEEEEETYKERLDSYQRETQLKEAIQTGTGQINGIPVAIGVMDFRFMAGSMGFVVGEKITRLIEYATQKFLPLIIVCASGGARMQEGSLSLMQMAKISSALLDYQVNKKLFYISILTSPTTGGVTASFGMLGDIVIAEPNAYIAFAGKRVIEETLKIIVPEGVQETEYLFDKGAFDLIVPRTLLKSVLTELFHFHAFFPLNQNSIK